jgi:hypothetical protein
MGIIILLYYYIMTDRERQKHVEKVSVVGRAKFLSAHHLHKFFVIEIDVGDVGWKLGGCVGMLGMGKVIISIGVVACNHVLEAHVIFCESARFI